MFCNLYPPSLFLFFGVSSQVEDEEEEDQPLSLSWPESNRKRLTYLLIIPVVLPLWLTLPDVRKPVCETRALPLKTFETIVSSVLFKCGNGVFADKFTIRSLVVFQSAQKFFPITFLGAISWIAVFSYLMVWWAHQVHSSQRHVHSLGHVPEH